MRTPCMKVWCGPCYTPLDDGEFPVAKPVDEDGLVIEEGEDDHRFMMGRDGDNLITPFQCDLCHFRNLFNRDPVNHLAQDIRMQKLIQQANLDALWAREPLTIKSNLMTCRQGLSIATSLGFGDKLFRPMGPFPLEDTFGMGAAVVMLQQSLQPGRNAAIVQFGTIRKFCSAFSNAYLSSAEGQQAMVMAKDTKKLRVTKCPTYGEFFERFVRGVHKRMGDIVKQDKALSIVLLKEIFLSLEEEWLSGGLNQMGLAKEGAFYSIAYCCALRGEEAPLADLYGMIKHWKEGEEHELKHVVVALLGRFKGETGESYHLMPIVAVTSRGLEPRKWIGRLLDKYKELGITHGPLFRNMFGQRSKSGEFEEKFLDRLSLTKPHLMGSTEDISEEYGVYRSFRRGATSEAVNEGVPPEVIDANNRWRRKNQAGASRPTLTMREHYTDVKLTLKNRLRFSKAL